MTVMYTMQFGLFLLFLTACFLAITRLKNIDGRKTLNFQVEVEFRGFHSEIRGFFDKFRL